MVGQNIKSYMAAHGIKQRWLAEKVGLSETAMSAKLNGLRGFTFEEYERICGALGIRTDTFLEPQIKGVKE